MKRRRSGRASNDSRRSSTESGEVGVVRTVVAFGAGVLADGEPSAMLFDRVRHAAKMYGAGEVQKMVLSGDGFGDRGHDEVDVMRRVAIHFGVPPADIVEDRLGVSTTQTLARIVTEFALTDVVLVTQRFHARRVAMLARAVGLEFEVVALPDTSRYGRRAVVPLHLREILASVKCLFDVPQLWRIARKHRSR